MTIPDNPVLALALEAQSILSHDSEIQLRAAKLWNETYSERAYRRALADGFRERRKHGEKIIRDRSRPGQQGRVKADWMFLRRMNDALASLRLRDEIKWERLSSDGRDLPLVLLIAVMILRPDFNAEAWGVDEETPWDERGDFGRAVAGMGAFTSLSTFQLDPKTGKQVCNPVGRLLKPLAAAITVARAKASSEAARRGDAGGTLPDSASRNSRDWPVTKTLDDFGKLIEKKPSFADTAITFGIDAAMQRELMRRFILYLRTNISALSTKYRIEPAQRHDDDPFKEFDLMRLWYAHAVQIVSEVGPSSTTSEQTELERARKHLDFAKDAAQQMMVTIDSWEKEPPDESMYPDALTYFMDHATSLRRLRDNTFSMVEYFKSAADYLSIRAFTRELVTTSRFRQIENGPMAILDSRLAIMGPFISPKPKQLQMRPPDDPFWIELAAAEAWVMQQKATLRGLVTIKESNSRGENAPAKSAGPENQTGVADPVTMSQVALFSKVSKRKLEADLKDGLMPQPTIRGGKGRAHCWNWPDLLPYLKTVSNRTLPSTFPGNT